MTYLLAKFALLFVVAALSGFIFGRWLTRRSYVDVTESYEDLRATVGQTDVAQWDKLWRQLAAISVPKEVDISPVTERLTNLQTAVEKIPAPVAADLKPVENRLDELNKRVSSIPIPLTLKISDLKPIADRLTDLDAKIAALPLPQKAEVVNLDPVISRLSKVDDAVRNLPRPERQREPDLQPIRSELASLREDVRRIPKPEVPPTLDLTPVESRLTLIESRLGELGSRLEKSPTSRAEPRRVPRDEPVILSAALYGKKDDLRLISGVGPKLERLLNTNGVYYFWQVADWAGNDIEVMDERLDTFKGRIQRDQWVSQAQQLSKQSDAARRPEEQQSGA